MYRKHLSRLSLAGVISITIVILSVLPALAAPPPNDDISTPTMITTLPFSEATDVNEATLSPDDPASTCPNFGIQSKTVWYVHTAEATQNLTVSTADSWHPIMIAIFSGSPGALTEVACGHGGQPFAFRVNAGITYYIMVSNEVQGSGWLHFSLAVATPPSVDFTYNADYYTFGIWTVHFQGQINDPSCPYFCGKTAFWDFGDGTTSTEWGGLHQFPGDGAYKVTFTVTTSDGRSGTIQKEVVVSTPPPNVYFYSSAWEPSIYDSIYFYNYSWDHFTNSSEMNAQWDFGDGSTSNEWSPVHQYTADGNYTLTLTVTTPDGRSASTSASVQVRTYDVSIARFIVPQSAKAGQTRTITVELVNNRYPSEVYLELYKGSVGYWQWIDATLQQVPVRGPYRTYGVEFKYTFTAEDAQVGKINFLVVAELYTWRDALPANNTAISLPTKVMR